MFVKKSLKINKSAQSPLGLCLSQQVTVGFGKGYQKRDEVLLSGAVLQAQVAGKVVGDKVRLAALHRRAHGTHNFGAGVRVLGAHVLGQGDVGEAHLVAVRTGEALRPLGGKDLAAVVELEVGAREDALHRVVRLVAAARRALLVAVGAQVVVVADQALEAPAPEVALEARIAAHTCEEEEKFVS